jgi:hypothetical protein
VQGACPLEEGNAIHPGQAGIDRDERHVSALLRQPRKGVESSFGRVSGQDLVVDAVASAQGCLSRAARHAVGVHDQ